MLRECFDGEVACKLHILALVNEKSRISSTHKPIKNPPDSFSDKAKNALRAIKLLPDNVYSFKLTHDESVELKVERGEKRERDSSVIVEVDYANALLREVKYILENASDETPWTTLCVCLLIASGRRTIEILNGQSMFSPSVGKHFCIFEGQAKKRFDPDLHSIPFEIPLLVEFDVFIDHSRLQCATISVWRRECHSRSRPIGRAQ